MLRAAALVSAALAGVIRGIHHGKKVVAISGKKQTENKNLVNFSRWFHLEVLPKNG